VADKVINVVMEATTATGVRVNVSAPTSEVDTTLPTKVEALQAFQALYATLSTTPPVSPTPDPPPGG
jgi:hypothetical protein